MTRTFAAAALLLVVQALPANAETPAAAAPGTIVVPARVERALSRPAALPALYVSLAGLQAYDVFSTRQALSSGAREVNPMMSGVVGNPAAFWAVKATVTAGTIFAAERLWKNNNKAAAIALMVASNSVAAIVASRNARTLRQLN